MDGKNDGKDEKEGERMENTIYSFIKVSHLNALGLETEQVYFLMFSLGAIITYLIVHPVISWFIELKSAKLLSYVVSSMLVIIVLFINAMYMEGIASILFNLLDTMLQVLGWFGIILILYYCVRKFMGKI